MSGSYLLAIDAGTGSCRAVLFTEKGEQVAASLREWTHREPPDAPGGQDFDVDANWLLIAACIQDALARRGRDRRRRARRRGDQHARGHRALRRGRARRSGPARTSTAARRQEAAELIAEGAADRIYALGGDWVSITTPARLRWLARHRPDILARPSGLGMLSDWIATRLSGVLATEPSCGSSSGMFCLADRTWSDEIAAICGIDRQRSSRRCSDPGTVIGTVTAARRRGRPGLRPGTPVVAGGADTQLGLLGAGARPGEYTVVAGTFWQNTILLDRPLIDPQIRLRTLCHVLPGQWMLEGIGFYCGMSMRWFRDAFCDAEVAQARRRGVDPYVVMEESGRAGAARLGRGARDPVEPHERPALGARGAVVPRLRSRRPGRARAVAACVRAIEEAAAYVARGHRDIIAELTGVSFAELVFTGGAPRARSGRRSSPTCSASRCTSRWSTRAARSARRSARARAPGSTAACTDLESDLRRRVGDLRTRPGRGRHLRRAVRDAGARSTGGCSTMSRRRPAQPAVAGRRRLAPQDRPGPDADAGITPWPTT